MRVEALVLGLLLVFAGTATAQLPSPDTGASMSVSLDDVPSEINATAGDTVEITGNMTLTASEFGCSDPVTIPGEVTSNVTAETEDAAPDGLPENVSSGTLNFTLPGEVFISDPTSMLPAGGAYEETLPVSLNLSTVGGVTESYTLNLSLAGATEEVDASTTCVPGTFPAAQSNAANLSINLEADQEPDADGDGVIDSEDDCPNEAGTEANDGCPEEEEPEDSDGDGVIDSEDDCPTEAGTEANDGCPEEDEEPPVNDTNDTDQPPANDSDGEEENGSPIPWQLALLAVAVAAIVYRRKS